MRYITIAIDDSMPIPGALTEEEIKAIQFVAAGGAISRLPRDEYKKARSALEEAERKFRWGLGWAPATPVEGVVDYDRDWIKENPQAALALVERYNEAIAAYWAVRCNC